MIRLMIDEDFDNDILRGVLRRRPGLDIVRAQDVGGIGRSDPDVLELAASQNRILLSHDVSTMISHANARLAAGRSMPGLFAVPQSLPIGTAIDEILLLAECSNDGEWEGQIHFLPL